MSYRRRQALLTAETVIALAVVGILATALATTISHQHKASRRLAESRADMRLAESVLLAMQTGEPRPAAPDGVKISVQPADVAGRTGPQDCAWAAVRVIRGGRTSVLLGLVRTDALKAAREPSS
jgi:type II secretory pathway pseudopilin PulG